MLTIPLARLEREGTLEFQAEIPPDDPIWEGAEFSFAAPLNVTGKAEWLGGGEVLVEVFLEGRRAQECRRCLEPVETVVEEEWSLLFLPEEEVSGSGGDESARVLPEDARELELGPVVREEMILADQPFVLCREDCKGLCPSCGVNLNEETCQCSTEELDPRWDALRALRDQ